MSVYSPEAGSRIQFYAATAFVRDFDPKGKVSRGSHDHGNQRVLLDIGYILIDLKWNLGPQEPAKEIPELTEKRQFERAGGKGEQRTKAAIEISLNEHHNQFQWHVYWDLLKLSDPENEIQTRIILFFLRDYP